MADRFEEMARAWLDGQLSDVHASDIHRFNHNDVDALAALLRKVYDEASEQGADGMLDFLQAEYVLTKDPLSPDAEHLARKVSKYTAEMRELLAARKVVDAARHVPGGVFGDNATKATALAGLSAALFEYDKAVGG